MLGGCGNADDSPEQSQDGQALMVVDAPPAEPPTLAVNGVVGALTAFRWFNQSTNQFDTGSPGASMLPADLPRIVVAPTVTMLLDSTVRPTELSVRFVRVDEAGDRDDTVASLDCLQDDNPCLLSVSDASLILSFALPPEANVVVVNVMYASTLESTGRRDVGDNSASYAVRVE
jgi:hypothetical protein